MTTETTNFELDQDGEVIRKDDAPDETSKIILELIDMLGESFSGYISGSGEDEKWHKQKALLIADAKNYV